MQKVPKKSRKNGTISPLFTAYARRFFFPTRLFRCFRWFWFYSALCRFALKNQEIFIRVGH